MRNYKLQLLFAFLKIVLVLLCAFILILSLVYHWVFPTYVLKILGAFIILISIFGFLRIFYHTRCTNEAIIYECYIQSDFLHIFTLIGSFILSICFCIVDILLGIGIFLYLLKLSLQDWYYKAQLSKTCFTLYHRVYGKLSYKWDESSILSSLDKTQSPMFYVNLSETYYLHIWHKGTVINVTIKKNEDTLKLYEYIKRYRK